MLIAIACGIIYVLYGQPGSGKTTLSVLLSNHLKSFAHIIDGDHLRKMTNNCDFSKSGREQNILKANELATRMHGDSNYSYNVIMALVNPYKHLRDQLKNQNPGKVVEILLTSKRTLRKEYHVEDFELGNPDICLNTDRDEVFTVESLMSMLDNYQVYP